MRKNYKAIYKKTVGITWRLPPGIISTSANVFSPLGRLRAWTWTELIVNNVDKCGGEIASVQRRLWRLKTSRNISGPQCVSIDDKHIGRGGDGWKSLVVVGKSSKTQVNFFLWCTEYWQKADKALTSRRKARHRPTLYMRRQSINSTKNNWSANVLLIVHLLLNLHTRPYTVWVKNPPWGFLTFFPKRLGILVQILPPYCTFLCTLDYNLFSKSATLTKLCHIKRDHRGHVISSKCPPSAEMHAGCGHT